MNIFYLHKDPKRAAEMHCDQHVVKMPLEVAQMACTNVILDHLNIIAPDRKIDKDELTSLREFANTQRPLPQEERFVPYLPCHANHPCTIWMRSSYSNWVWAIRYALELEKEYVRRYGKPNLKAGDVIRKLPVPHFQWEFFSTPPLALPDQYKCDDPVQSYRNYYRTDKRAMARWNKGVEPPGWF